MEKEIYTIEIFKNDYGYRANISGPHLTGMGVLRSDKEELVKEVASYILDSIEC